MNLSIVTITSDRPIPWKHWQRVAPRAINDFVGGEVQLVIVDDGKQPVFSDFNDHPSLPMYSRFDYRQLSPLPSKDPKKSFFRNLSTALSMCEFDTVVIMEDDDWYAPDYLNCVSFAARAGYDVVGFKEPLYYHVPGRRYRVFKDIAHTSLSQTILCTRAAMDAAQEIIEKGEVLCVDARLWEKFKDSSWLFPAERKVSIGIKGLSPGNHVAEWHNPEPYKEKDPSGDFLRSLVGDEDAEFLFNLAKEIKS